MKVGTCYDCPFTKSYDKAVKVTGPPDAILKK